MYATLAEIRRASRNLAVVQTAEPSVIRDWGREAVAIINRFCSQDFTFEQGVAKSVVVNGFPTQLPKTISGNVSVASLTGKEVTPPVVSVESDGTVTLTVGDYDNIPGKTYLVYRPARYDVGPGESVTNLRSDVIRIFGDWGYAPSEEFLIVNYANDLKASYNAHLADVVVHNVPDGVNTIGSPDATDLDSAMTIINEALVVMPLHFQDAAAHVEVDNISFAGLVPATDELTAMTLSNQLKNRYNAHAVDTSYHLEAAGNDTLICASVDNPVLPYSIKLVFLRLVKRIAIRDNLDDDLQFNNYYTSETTGDGYQYNLSNPTLRNVLRPEDKELLWPYIKHGVIVT